jgi:hyperosmotically inducible periplasmic protein
MEEFMKIHLAASCATFAVLLGGPALATAQDSHSSAAHAETYVKDSAITTKIKTRLAAEHMASLGDVHVTTDKDGVVWLSGSVKTRQAAKKAVSIARSTAHVTGVHSRIKVISE